VLVEPGGLFVVQVGDSRCYLGRDRSLVQLTRDQTVWESMIAAGREKPDGLEHAPWTNMLMQAVGSQPDVDEVTTERDLQPGDWLVLCTDGLYRVVPPGDIAGVLAMSSSAPEKARALVALANERGGPDNVTTIVCQVNAK
jgi:Serine/threonine protein phosphatase